jgi:hypothetical protein
MLRKLRQLGLTSDMMYAAGLGSIGLSILSWYVSKNKENIDRADRWGLFVGEWAPTFFALGAGLRLEEEFEREGRGTQLTSTSTSTS